MEVWSHRGRMFPSDTGNSLKGFEALYDMGVRHIEADLALTINKEVIIYHPRSTFPDLIKLRRSEYKALKNPPATFNGFLRFLSKYPDLKFCLDIKQNNRGLMETAVNGLFAYCLMDQVYLTAFQKSVNFPPFKMSSDGQLLLFAKEVCPEIKTHVIATYPFNLRKIVRKYRADAISFGWLPDNLFSRIFFKGLVKPFADIENQIADVRKDGVKVWAGIFNDPREMLYFADMGVDGIMTDTPGTMLGLVENQKIS